jgi:hypothetical protein
MYETTDPETEQFTITVFDDEMPNNKDHPANAKITIPNKKILACKMVIEGYLDLDDSNRRGVYFYFDNIGGQIGAERINAQDTIGDVLLGGNFYYEYGMDEVQIAEEWPERGYFKYKYLPPIIKSKNGTISPGTHSIVAYISSDDSSSGAVIESWISIRLEFNGGFTLSSAIIISLVLAIIGIGALYEYIQKKKC